MSIFRSDTSGQALAYRDFVQREERFVRAPYNPELEFYQAVVSVNLKKVKEMTKESFLAKKEGWGTLSANPVQNVKYHFAITAAVIARYCTNAGMDLHVAYNLSDYYISAADRCHTGGNRFPPYPSVSGLHPTYEGSHKTECLLTAGGKVYRLYLRPSAHPHYSDTVVRNSRFKPFLPVTAVSERNRSECQSLYL